MSSSVPHPHTKRDDAPQRESSAAYPLAQALDDNDPDPDPPTDSRAVLIARYSVNTLFWTLAVVLVAFAAVQCDRYLALRLREAHARPRPPIYSGPAPAEDMRAQLDRLVTAPITLGGVDVYPTAPICLRSGFGLPDAGDWTALDRGSSWGHLDFTCDARAYVVDTGFDANVSAEVHVVPGSDATVDVAASYGVGGKGALDAYEVCIYRADAAPLTVDVFRIQRRIPVGATDTTKDASSSVRFNVTLQLPTLTRTGDAMPRALRIGRYEAVTLHAGLTVRDLDIYTPGSVHAQSGFAARGMSVRTYGPRGNVTGRFAVAAGHVGVGTYGAGVDARFDVTRRQGEDGRTRMVVLEAYDAPLNAMLKLVDEAADSCARVSASADPHCMRYRPFAFDIRATSSSHPQELTLVEGSSYPPGITIHARATDAAAVLRLDSSFKGTYHFRTAKNHYGGEIMSKEGVRDPEGRGREKVKIRDARTQYGYFGATGWGSGRAARKGASYAEVAVDASLKATTDGEGWLWDGRFNG
ncbi:unnamed protein product [Peniophora sp. CBMAI 1063]|nr:unnamed protein product [Peniophora sp. CBMAI 1063]